MLEVWPDNQLAADFFASQVGTCWVHTSTGMGAYVSGLRWEALYPLMDRLQLAPDAWRELHADLQVMEAAALAQINAKRD